MSTSLPPLPSLALKADQCVRCGLCLPHCPTFTQTKEENHGPRGRIGLIQALDQGALKPDPWIQEALESCLSCYQCQSVCPAQVDYSALIETARARWAQTPLGLMNYLQYRLGIRLSHWGLWLLHFLAPRLGQKILGLSLPPIPRPTRFLTYYPPQGRISKTQPLTEVSLFLGCLTSMVHAPLIHRSITLLQQLGYGVHVPKAQTCCGALFLHGGYPQKAQRCQAINQSAFPTQRPVLTFASGCQRDLPGAIDILAFLAEAPWPSELTFKPLNQRLLLHAPCTQAPDTTLRIQTLLAQIPQLSLTLWPQAETKGCCGAAGLQLIRAPEKAQALQTIFTQGLDLTAFDGLLTSNIGCELHFLQTHALKVQHPLECLLTSL